MLVIWTHYHLFCDGVRIWIAVYKPVLHQPAQFHWEVFRYQRQNGEKGWKVRSQI
jgi:hypothetical protein